jgi:hypothetical protein
MRNSLLLETPKALTTKYLSKGKYGDDLTSIVKMLEMSFCSLKSKMKWTISRREPKLANGKSMVPFQRLNGSWSLMMV